MSWSSPLLWGDLSLICLTCFSGQLCCHVVSFIHMTTRAVFCHSHSLDGHTHGYCHDICCLIPLTEMAPIGQGASLRAQLQTSSPTARPTTRMERGFWLVSLEKVIVFMLRARQLEGFQPGGARVATMPPFLRWRGLTGLGCTGSLHRSVCECGPNHHESGTITDGVPWCRKL